MWEAEEWHVQHVGWMLQQTKPEEFPTSSFSQGMLNMRDGFLRYADEGIDLTSIRETLGSNKASKFIESLDN